MTAVETFVSQNAAVYSQVTNIGTDSQHHVHMHAVVRFVPRYIVIIIICEVTAQRDLDLCKRADIH